MSDNSSHFTTNLEYLYISYAKKCKIKKGDGKPDDKDKEHHCGKYKYCKYCMYNGVKCFEPDIDVRTELIMFEKMIEHDLFNKPLPPEECDIECEGRHRCY